jgi:glycosyltransferase involved in cell wall biosynthesis/SAM-dependent methyltransferase
LRFLRDMFDDVAAIYSDDYFDKNADNQSPQFGYASYHSSLPIDFRWQQSLLRLFGADTPGTLLDVGCATGRFLSLARADGHRARGVELANVAAELTRAMGFEVDATLSDVAADARFDVITAWELIEHVPDLRGTLTAIRDHLAEGGLFLFSTPDAGAPAVTARGDEWIGLKTSLEHLTYLTTDFLTPLLREVFDCDPEFISAGTGELSTLVGIVRRGGLTARDRDRREKILSRALTPRDVAREIAWFWLAFDDVPAARALIDAVRAVGEDTHVAEALLALRTWGFEAAEKHLERVVERSGWSSEVLQLMWRASLIRRDNANAQLIDARAVEAKLRGELAASDGHNRELTSALERAQRTVRLLEAELGEAKQRLGELERQVATLYKQLDVAMQSVASSAEQLRLLQVSAGYRIGRRVTRVLERMPLAQPVWNRLDELANDGVRSFLARRLDRARSTVSRLLRPKEEPAASNAPAAPPANTIVQKRRPLIYVPIESGFVRGLISVILPVYNQASLLAESIDSVLRQTYPHFELIVLNDGSKDDVERVLDRYRGHPKVRILTQPNQGLPKALSNAFELAQGELWTWTSADNIMEPVQLERMFAFLRSRPDIDMTFADYLAIDDRGMPLTDPSFRPHNRKSPNAPEIHLPHDVSTLNTVQDNFIGPCFMYRGHVGLALGEYDPDMGVEDYDYWMRVNTLFQLEHFGTEEILYRYRVHDNSLNARAVEHRIYERVAKLMEYEQERKRAYDEPFTLVPDERSREIVELLNLAPRAIIGTHGTGAGGKRVEVLAGDAPTPRLPRPGQPAIVWFERDSRAPYRWASAFSRPEVVAAAVDEETLKRIAAAGGRGFGHAELARGFGAALAALDSTLFYERTRPRSLRLRHPPEIYRARESSPTILLEVGAFDKGGLEQVVIDLAVVLRDGGANVIIAVLGAIGTAARTAQSLGFQVVAIPEQQRAEEYAALLERERVSIVNGHYSLFGVEICARAKIPFVQTIHNSYVWFTDEDKAKYRAADAFTTAYICVSMTAAQFSDVFLGLPPEKIVVLTNGIDTEKFRPPTQSQRDRARARHNIPKDAFVYLNVAGISDHKGQRQLVEAFQEVHRRHPESRLVIAGSVYWADFADELRKLIAASGIGDAIHITGHVLNIEELYAASDAFVLPSFFEGWSLALAEALCSGLPSIATDCGAAREVLAETGGELVPLPYASLAELDLTKLKTYMNVSEPLRSQLIQAMLRVYDERPRPTVTEGTRRRYDRAQAFARHRDLFDWLLIGGSPASARRWLRAREADAVAAAEASGVTKSVASA